MKKKPYLCSVKMKEMHHISTGGKNPEYITTYTDCSLTLLHESYHGDRLVIRHEERERKVSNKHLIEKEDKERRQEQTRIYKKGGFPGMWKPRKMKA